MQTIGGFGFPESTLEAVEWEPVVRLRALHPDVLAVARTRIEGTWAAYVAAVPGEDHDWEAEHVLDRGTKLPFDVAKAVFPAFAELPYAS